MPYEKIKEISKDINLLYADGYKLDSDELDETLLSEARTIATQADVAIIFAGLPEHMNRKATIDCICRCQIIIIDL